MKYIYNLSILGVLAIMCSACKTQVTPPEIVSPVEVKAPVLETNHSLGIIGAVEPIYILPMKTPFSARIDTGAATSSIDVNDLKIFERDGEKWVSFLLVNRDTGERHRFEKEVSHQVTIKRVNEHEKRPTVQLDVKFGNEIIKTNFTLADRQKFEYQALVGRNILSGRAVVDTSLENTLH